MKTITIAAIMIFTAATAQGQIRSLYSVLSDKGCKTIEENADEGGSYRGECPGVGGYKLELVEGDLRQTLNVIDPKRKKHELGLWNIFGGFSSIGHTAEWRLKGGKPFALIVRFNVSENPEDSTKITSYLLVAKITPSETCVTDVIKPSRTQNTAARRAADKSGTSPCRNTN